MTLYLYRIGTAVPIFAIDNVKSYSENKVVTEDGVVYTPLAEDCELSSLPDCSETLRADWKRDNPSDETRMEELETLVAELLFGGEK